MKKKAITVTMRFGDVIISVTLSAPECSQTASLSVTIRRWQQNTWLFFLSRLIVVKFGLKLYNLCNSDL